MNTPTVLPNSDGGSIPRLWRAMVEPGTLAGIPSMVRFTIQVLVLKGET